ncbi:hypothetical protein J2X19_000828 [Rhodoferax ferrireducens]|uniref:Pentapeptide repeat n=1 Tax=Rhodoferax ferrireducens TaxID=192843 RepID=A0ABU2C4C4_9BURK|nr:pentapeptide repeat-containing protein [Rhodoferax ferrireducens]MDR7376170.1 hypothetical protein [Rhodoferax ferrireducens]
MTTTELVISPVGTTSILSAVQSDLKSTEPKLNQSTSTRSNEASALVSKPSITERLATWAEKSPSVRLWVRINQSMTVLSLIVASIAFALAYLKYTEDNHKADEDRVAKAWDVVVRMSGRQSNGGQVSAMERLVRSNTSLARIDLHQTFLAHAKLEKADLQAANLAGSDLSGANMRHARLAGADLSGANLSYADLSGADLSGVNLGSANLAFATIDVNAIEARSIAMADITGARFVYVDDDDSTIWDTYADTLGEGDAAQNVQHIIDSTCSDARFNEKLGREVPFVIHARRCPHPLDYESLKRQRPSMPATSASSPS